MRGERASICKHTFDVHKHGVSLPSLYFTCTQILTQIMSVMVQ